MMIDYETELSKALLGDEYEDGSVPVMVANLRDTYDKDALAACWHYITEGSMPVDDAIDFTMKRFKGFFASLGEFAEDLYTDSLEATTANLPYRDAIAFGDYIDWSGVGDELKTAGKIEVVVVDSGVYVFDNEDV